LKVPDLSKWQHDNHLIGLLLFAQLVDELLFDYTIDTYKVPALNSNSLCYELLHAIHGVESGYLERGVIAPLLEELEYNLGKDPVIREILGLHHEQYVNSLNIGDSLPDMKTKINYLVKRIENKYFDTCKSLLKKTISEQKEKDKINRLTRIFITELVNEGYSPGCIYFENLRFFFEGPFPEKIDSLKLLDRYFECFDKKEKEWNIIFWGEGNFSLISKFIKKIDIVICETVPSLTFRDKVDEFFKRDPNFPICLMVRSVKALDAIKARQIAENELLMVDSLVKYHVHRRGLCWKDEVLCYTTDQKYFTVCRRPISPVMKRPDRPAEKLSTLVDETLSAITNEMLTDGSLERLIRALRLHSTALDAASPQNQILDFWTAIEILLPPSKEKEGKSRIEQIADLLTPFITEAYAAKLATDLYRSIKASGEEAMKILEKIKIGDNKVDKCMALFSIKKNEKIREELYKRFEWHPILKNRIYFLFSRFNSSKTIARTLKDHMQRISWQIRRIYRTRNLIIHSGEILPYLNILVENLHSYLDRVFDLIHTKVTRSSHRLTLDEIALEIKLEHDAHIKLLEKSDDLECTEENYKRFLFGG